MSTIMVQVRNVPADVHRRLKSRAALEGMSISAYVLREIDKALERPTRLEVLERLRSLPTRRPGRSAAAVIRAERDSR